MKTHPAVLNCVVGSANNVLLGPLVIWKFDIVTRVIVAGAVASSATCRDAPGRVSLMFRSRIVIN